MRSSSSIDRRRWARALLVSMTILAASLATGCGGVVLVIGGAIVGATEVSQNAAGGGGGSQGCGDALDATYQGLGPEGGICLSIAVSVDPGDPTTARIYVGTEESGVFFTDADLTDPAGWADWTASAGDLTDASVKSLAVSPINRDIVLAGTDEGLFRSDDGGATWGSVSVTGGDDEVCHVTFAPWDPNDAFAATDNRIFLSQDDGTTWIEEQSGIQVAGFASVHGTPSTLFAGTRQSGVWSRQATSGWGLAAAQPPETRIVSMAAQAGGCPSPDEDLYAITETAVWLSTDSGASWSDWAPQVGNNQIRLLAVACDYEIAITQPFASDERGLFLSSDEGASWRDIRPADNILSVAIAPEAPDSIFVGTDGQGVYWSSNRGEPPSWSEQNRGLHAQKVLSLAVHPLNPHHAYAGTEAGGLMETMDGGANWTVIDLETLAGRILFPIEIRSLAIDPDYPDTLYVGTAGNGVFEVIGGVAGAIPDGTGMIGGTVNAIAIDTRSRELYAGMEKGVFVRFQTGQSLKDESRDLNDPRVTALAIDASTDPSTIYLGARGGEIYQGTSSGLRVDWTKIAGAWPRAKIESIAVTRETRPMLFVAVEDAGVYRRPASGGSWHPVFSCLYDLDVEALAASNPIQGQIPARVYAATGKGLFRLDSTGQKWKAIGGAEGENPAFSVALPPWGTFAVYAGFQRGARQVTVTE